MILRSRERQGLESKGRRAARADHFEPIDEWLTVISESFKPNFDRICHVTQKELNCGWREPPINLIWAE